MWSTLQVDICILLANFGPGIRSPVLGRWSLRLYIPNKLKDAFQIRKW